MSEPIVILDFTVDGAIWIQGEGIWLRELAALGPVMDRMYADGYLVDYRSGSSRTVGTGFVGHLRATASKADHPGGIPRDVHIMSLVMS